MNIRKPAFARPPMPEVPPHSRGTFALLAVACVLAAALSASAADVLFPRPLHLTRELHDSIGGTTTVVEQYCYGNRVVAVSGDVTTIADYGRGELTEIDRAAGTYSVTRFDEVAKAVTVTGAPKPAAQKEWQVRNTGDGVEAQLDEETVTRRTRVRVDRAVPLSRDALDVLIGAAYPNQKKAEDQVVVSAARSRGGVSTHGSGTSANDAVYALPVEQHLEVTVDGERAEQRDRVTRIGAELAPPEVLAIPPGATLVQSRLLVRMHAIEAAIGKSKE